ncbi:MAG: PqqD family protein [Bacteroidales bacterium]|nr:PqqD family protein [Bacteroidales bacterium]
MKLKKNIAVSENGFLFDPNSGESYSLNKTGQLIVKLISEGKSEAEIIENIMEKYDVESNALQRYLDDFIMMLQQMNLLQKEED